jgi:WD40 repeat protein
MTSPTAVPVRPPRGRLRRVLPSALLFLSFAAFFWWWLPSASRLTLAGKDSLYRPLGLSPDGSLLAVLKSPRPVPKPPPAQGKADLAQVFVDAMVTGSHLSGQVEVWAVAPGTLQASLPTEALDMEHVNFSPDGQFVVIVGSTENSHFVRLWEARTGREYATLNTLNADDPLFFRAPRSYQFSPDGRTIAYGRPVSRDESREVEDVTVTLWDVARRQDRARLPGARLPLAFAPDGRTLATRGNRQRPNPTWLQHFGKQLLALGGWAAYPTAAPGNLLLALGSLREEAPPPKDMQEACLDVMLWDADGGTERATLRTAVESSHHSLDALAWAPDGRTLAALVKPFNARSKFDLLTWDLAARKESRTWRVATLKGLDTLGMETVRFLDSSPRLLAETYHPLVGSRSLLCDLAAQTPREQLVSLGHKAVLDNACTRVAVDDGDAADSLGGLLVPLLAGGEEKKTPPRVRLVDVASMETSEFCRLTKGGAKLTPLAFSSDGRLLAVHFLPDLPGVTRAAQPGLAWILGREGAVRVYDVPTKRVLGEATGQAALFAADGRTLITSGGGAVRMYDLPLRPPLVGILTRSLLLTGLLVLLGRAWRGWRQRRAARRAAQAIPANSP